MLKLASLKMRKQSEINRISKNLIILNCDIVEIVLKHPQISHILHFQMDFGIYLIPIKFPNNMKSWNVSHTGNVMGIPASFQYYVFVKGSGSNRNYHKGMEKSVLMNSDVLEIHFFSIWKK